MSSDIASASLPVLLINPHSSPLERYGSRLASLGPVTEPLGLAYLAGVAEERGYPVKILDMIALGLTPEALPGELDIRQYAVVGITINTPMFERAAEVARWVRSRHPGALLVAGGPHPTALPLETLEDIPQLDFVVCGEGEMTFAEILASTRVHGGRTVVEDPGIIAGIAFRRDGERLETPARTGVANLDDLPLPARHLLPMDRYRTAVSNVGQGHAFTVIPARGCPFRCSFCSHPFGRTFRRHSPGRVVREIQFLVSRYGAREIRIEADTLSVHRAFLRELCSSLVDSGLHRQVRWSASCRADCVDRELLEAMRQAGCWQIAYGVESGSQRLLDLIQKGERLDDFRAIFPLTRQIGISTKAFFMLGLPTETREESLETIRFACELDPDWVQFTLTTPYPGTPMFEQTLEGTRSRPTDWSRFNTWAGLADRDLVYVPEGRTAAELKELQKFALRRFYCRPRPLLRFLGSCSSWDRFRTLLSGARVLMPARSGQ
ncbi:MAG: B12-binding domain-containing radical SAM protein [Magnetococcales bacterium]|nr:B12-binding domain-containing radical SAM protein [Magnetococcales bacterium]